MEKTLKVFIESYLETALWSSTDLDGTPLDAGDFSDVVFSLEALKNTIKDCREFIASPLFELAVKDVEKGDYFDSITQVAHDFWLTRNHHGAGFWDGDYSDELGEKLTDFSQEFGELDLYVGDDRKFYL